MAVIVSISAGLSDNFSIIKVIILTIDYHPLLIKSTKLYVFYGTVAHPLKKQQKKVLHVFGVFKASRQRQNEYAKNQKHISLFQMINQISFIHHYELSVTAVLLKQL